MSNNKFKVLIIEDEANICSFIQTLLETNGYQALVAQTCVMGMTMFISYNPDLVILDLGLPDRDRVDAAADRLADERGVVDGERDQRQNDHVFEPPAVSTSLYRCEREQSRAGV